MTLADTLTCYPCISQLAAAEKQSKLMTRMTKARRNPMLDPVEEKPRFVLKRCVRLCCWMSFQTPLCVPVYLSCDIL